MAKNQKQVYSLRCNKCGRVLSWADGPIVWADLEALEDYADTGQWQHDVCEINGHPIDLCPECAPVRCPICEDKLNNDWEIGCLNGNSPKDTCLLVCHCRNGHAIVTPVKTEEP